MEGAGILACILATTRHQTFCFKTRLSKDRLLYQVRKICDVGLLTYYTDGGAFFIMAGDVNLIGCSFNVITPLHLTFFTN